MTVDVPCSASRRRARSAASRTSFTPALTALRDSKEAPTASASSRAMVVFPVPAGPQRMTEVSRRLFTRARRAPRGPKRWSWPRTSSRVRGRSRAANGPRRARRSFRAAVNRSPSEDRGTGGQATAPSGRRSDGAVTSILNGPRRAPCMLDPTGGQGPAAAWTQRGAPSRRGSARAPTLDPTCRQQGVAKSMTDGSWAHIRGLIEATAAESSRCPQSTPSGIWGPHSAHGDLTKRS